LVVLALVTVLVPALVLALVVLVVLVLENNIQFQYPSQHSCRGD
jgi:hypothetical protein